MAARDPFDQVAVGQLHGAEGGGGHRGRAAALFDSIDLDIDVTPAAINGAVRDGAFAKALVI